ncbi:GerMN domain-containing protein [Streptomyces sp. NPDC006645]|uniref:GerMN domain-containing protein n=1 Tax=unclassified Streptomyces TaxID=2593676 RepID=UPI0033AEEAB8
MRLGQGAAALAVTAAVLCLSSGCGVPPSGVIEVGEPATGMTLSKAVYFLDRTADPGSADPADGTYLHAVARPGIPDVDPVAAAVRELLAGPTPAESEYLTTALPPNLPAPDITVGTESVLIRFPEGTPRLTPAALHQLTCTTTLATRTTHTARPPSAPSTGTTSGGAPQQARTTIHITVQGTTAQPAPPMNTCP